MIQNAKDLAFFGTVKSAVPFDLLDFNLDERWIDRKIYSRFAPTSILVFEVNYHRQLMIML